LKALDDLYEKTRKKGVPQYPVNKKTDKIELPEDVIADLKYFSWLAINLLLSNVSVN